MPPALCFRGVTPLRPLILSLAVLAAAPAAAQQLSFVKGNDIIKWCEDTPRNGAFGFVTGAIESTQALGPDLPYCLPRAATLRQATDVVCNYLEDNPADRHLPAGVLTMTALSEAWPCPAP